MNAEKSRPIEIKKVDEDAHLVYGEVYAPNVLDSDKDFMTAETVQMTAHIFMLKSKTNVVDIIHDRTPIKGAIVESYIAPEESAVFTPGSWVVAIFVGDAEVWSRVKTGELNGFSMGALAVREPRTVEVTLPDDPTGQTLESNDHTHAYSLTFTDEGAVQTGSTDVVNGHAHVIQGYTVTEFANGHNHRYDVLGDHKDQISLTVVDDDADKD